MTMHADEFRVVPLEQQGRWAVVHNPTGSELLSLSREAYSHVSVVSEKDQLLVRAMSKEGKGQPLDMPIRSSPAATADPDVVLKVEVLGTGDNIMVHANEGDTVALLKQRLAGRCGIPASEQALWVGSACVDNDRALLKHTGIVAPGAYLRVGRCGKIRIGIRSDPFSVARLLLYPSTTVAELREIAAVRLNVPVGRQVVCFAGRRLPDEATLRECGVRTGSELEVLNRHALTSAPARLEPAYTRAAPPVGGGEELAESMGDVLGTVTTLVEQQSRLQETVSHLLQSVSGSVVRQRDPSHPLAYASPVGGGGGGERRDILSQSRKLRATAAVEAASALNLATVPGAPPPSLQHGHPSDILHQLAKEARALSEEHSTSSSISRMENTRKEYQMLRHEIQVENLKRDDGACKLCGVKAGEPAKPTTSAPAKPAPKPSGSGPAATGDSKLSAADTARRAPSTGSAVSAMRRQSAAAAGSRSKTDDVLVKTPSRPPSSSAPPTRHNSMVVPGSGGGGGPGPGIGDPTGPGGIGDPTSVRPPAGGAGSVVMPAALKKKDTSKGAAGKSAAKDDSDNDSVMGDHVMGDPEAVERWMKERGK